MSALRHPLFAWGSEEEEEEEDAFAERPRFCSSFMKRRTRAVARLE